MSGFFDAVAGIVGVATAVYVAVGIKAIWRDIRLYAVRRKNWGGIGGASIQSTLPSATQQIGAVATKVYQGIGTVTALNVPSERSHSLTREPAQSEAPLSAPNVQSEAVSLISQEILPGRSVAVQAEEDH